MSQFVGQLINGIMIGGIYALVAVAFNLIFGVLRVVYFAHGQVVMLGAYTALGIIAYTGNIFVAFVAAAVVGSALGIAMERVLIRRLTGAHHLMPLVSTVSVGVILEEAIRLTVNKGQVVSLPKGTMSGWPTWHFWSIAISAPQILVLAICIILVVGLRYLIQKSWYGRSVRAVAQDADRSAILGIDINRVASQTFALSSAITAVAGVLYSLIYVSFDPYFGDIFGIKALAVVLLGGLGSATGAAFGGFLLGIAEALASGYLASSWQDAFAFGLMMIILLVRPGGLAGVRQVLK